MRRGAVRCDTYEGWGGVQKVEDVDAAEAAVHPEGEPRGARVDERNVVGKRQGTGIDVLWRLQQGQRRLHKAAHVAVAKAHPEVGQPVLELVQQVL